MKVRLGGFLRRQMRVVRSLVAFLQHGLEYRLQLARRRTDDAQHLCCGLLSLQRLVASRVRRATFVSSRAADELRGRTAFGAMRALRAAAFGACALRDLPPALD